MQVHNKKIANIFLRLFLSIFDEIFAPKLAVKILVNATKNTINTLVLSNNIINFSRVLQI